MERMNLKKITRMKSKRCVQTEEDKARDILDILDKQAEVIKQQLGQIFRIQAEIELMEEIVYQKRCKV